MTSLKDLLATSRNGGFSCSWGDKKETQDKTAAPQKKSRQDTIGKSTISHSARDNCTPKKKVVSAEYVTTEDHAERALKDLMRKFEGEDAGVLGLDIETKKLPLYRKYEQAGLEPHLSSIRLVQICVDPSHVYVFDLSAISLDTIAPLFQYKMVAHNALFELKHLFHNGILAPDMECTLLMHNALVAGRKSLKDLTWECFKEKVSKVEQDSDWSAETLTEAQISYAALDAVLALRLYRHLLPKLSGRPQEKLYRMLQQAQYPVMKMEYHGCDIDAGTLFGLIALWETETETALKACNEIIGGSVNIDSARQISDWLEKNLGAADLKRWPKTDTGNLKTDAPTLQKYKHLPFVTPLAQYKTSAKLFSFGKGLIKHINPVTGRVHASFLIGAASTGRFTCSNPNLQNIPRDEEIRALIKARPGCKLVSADYSQVELRILAMIAKEPVMLKAYEDGKDLHKLTASKTSGVAFDDVSSEQRRAAKAINFGLVFGMGHRSLAEYARANYGVSMSIKEARSARETYFKTYPGILRWHRQTHQFAQRYGFIKTPSGRYVAMGNQAFTRSKNAPVQAGAAEVMTAALVEMDKATVRENLDARIVNMVHDEIVLEVAEDQAEQARTALENAMVTGMLKVFPEATTAGLVDAAIGDNWGETK